ncbi:MAG TPA: hypothetical protein VGD31_13175, partial [Sphingobacteriaceae bacterium]
PYVFITRNKSKIDESYIPDGLFFPTDKISVYNFEDKKSYTSYPTFEYLQLSKYHFACNNISKAVQICKLVRKGKDFEMQHSGVLEGFIYPLVKSNYAFSKSFIKSNGIQQKMYIIFNIAVVSSKLYTVDSEKPNSLPVEVPYVPFIRDIQTATIKGNQLITFVNEKYLEQFITAEIQTFTKAVERVLLENPDIFTFVNNSSWKVHTKSEAELKL